MGICSLNMVLFNLVFFQYSVIYKRKKIVNRENTSLIIPFYFRSIIKNFFVHNIVIKLIKKICTDVLKK